jgi:hypothetical protein
MKIALCFSGQPRYIGKSFEEYEKNILQNNDVDVFAHLWWDDSYQGKTFSWESMETYPVDYNPIDEFKEKFRPKNIIVEPHKPKEFFGYSNYSQKCLFDSSIQGDIVRSMMLRQVSQWYSIKQSMSFEELKDYDIIIRTRTDLRFEEHIDFSRFVMDKVYMMDGSLQCGGNRHYQDWFWFGPKEYVLSINNTYDRTFTFFGDGIRHMHELVQHSITEEGIPGEILDLGVYLMDRKKINFSDQRKILTEKTQEIQVDLVN